MSSSSEVDERTLREIYFPAIETAVREAHPWTVMCSYNRINGVFASENKWLLTDVLRDEWGFDGFVMSDWGAVSDRVKGLAAGLELEMPSSNGINDKKIVEAVRSGELDEKLLDLACERILKIIFRYTGHAQPETPWDLEAQDELAAQIETECAVLLKNDDDILPLSRSDKVAFIGEFAEKPRYQGGGSSHINSFRVTGALEAAKDLDVIYAMGYSGDDTTGTLIAQAAEAARISRAAVVFAGLPDSYESEGYDRKHIRLPDSQNRLIEAVASANPNTVVVLHNGSPVEMPWIDRVKAVLEVYLGGQAVGKAAVRLLFGDAVPSGHLAESFPVKLSDNPSYLYYGGEGDVTEYREGIFVGYRYYDKKDMNVLFPFGHGLSYTSFKYSDMKVLTVGTDTFVTVTVRNTGSRAGKAVVQVYTGAVGGDVIRPVRELKGFEKVSLEPGESKEVTVVLDRRAFSYWNSQMKDWYVPSGRYVIEAGDSSRSLPLRAEIVLEADRVPKRHYDVNSIMMDILADPKGREAVRPLLADNMFGNDSGNSDAAKDAISDEMGTAMINYLPLRGLISFGGNEETAKKIEELLKTLNS